MAQGIERDKDKVINEILQPLFKMGYSVRKACSYAGIPSSTVDTWIQNDDDLRAKITVWQNDLALQARKNIERRIRGTDIIVKEVKDPKTKEVIVRHVEEIPAVPDIGLSQWYLRTKERDEFSERVENVTAEITYDDLLRLQQDNLSQARDIEKNREPKQGLYDKLSGNT